MKTSRTTDSKKIEILEAAGFVVVDTRNTTGVICAMLNGTPYRSAETVAKLFYSCKNKIA